MAQEVTVGLDLGLSFIKVVVLSHKGKQPKLLSLGSVASPQPGILSDSPQELEKVAKSTRDLLTQVKTPINEVVVALPESKVFTRVIDDFPYLSDDELESAIHYSAEEFVPLPVDQVNLHWEVIGRSKSKNRTAVLVVAAPKNIVEKYLKVLELAALKPRVLETEIIAAARAIVGGNSLSPTTLICQLGASASDFAIVSKGMILLTRSISSGSIALTRAISQYLNLEVAQAEEYKKVYGLMEDQVGGKIYQIIKPLIDLVVAEVARIIKAYQVKSPSDPVKRVVLSGGGAKLPGLVVYMANSLGLEVQEADPWYLVEKLPSLQSKLISEGPAFTVAVGLALRRE